MNNSIRVNGHTISVGQNNLYGANLEGGVLKFWDLRGSDMRFANLRDVDFTGSNLEGVDLEGAHLLGANFFLAKVVLPEGWHLVDWVAYRIPGTDSFVRPKMNKYYVRRHPEDIHQAWILPRPAFSVPEGLTRRVRQPRR
jgi:hypothetical protein